MPVQLEYVQLISYGGGGGCAGGGSISRTTKIMNKQCITTENVFKSSVMDLVTFQHLHLFNLFHLALTFSVTGYLQWHRNRHWLNASDTFFHTTTQPTPEWCQIHNIQQSDLLCLTAAENLFYQKRSTSLLAAKCDCLVSTINSQQWHVTQSVVVVRASDSWLKDHEFNPRLRTAG